MLSNLNVQTTKRQVAHTYSVEDVYITIYIVHITEKISNISNEQICIQEFLVILKRPLQNY